MSEHCTRFGAPGLETDLLLPFDLDDLLAAWSAIRETMIRERPVAFSRGEWAYLISFLDSRALLAVFEQAFGARSSRDCMRARTLATPCRRVAIWLPNNVGLLGPLTVVLTSLAGCSIEVKAGSRSDDLTAAFCTFVQSRAGEPLAHLFNNAISVRRLERDDPQQVTMSQLADARIAFGSDESVARIAELPHRVDCRTFLFGNRVSEVWVSSSAVNPESLELLARVFMIYGTAACTAPARLVLLDGDGAALDALRASLLAIWPRVVRDRVPAHFASENIAARQWAAALGWDAVLCDSNSAVLAIGTPELEPFSASFALPMLALPVEAAAASMPSNIQTIGHLVDPPIIDLAAAKAAARGAARFVPLGRMHHFEPVWDGVAFWQALFSRMEVEG